MARLTDLLGVLPRVERTKLLSSAHSAITQPAEYSGFVAPPLKIPEGYSGRFDKPIVLISAPGAVGKSTLATHLAARHATALWDLSRIALGDNTFIGTLASTFGASQLGNILQNLLTGRALFVFDAFDEAELLSGWGRVESFVKEIWNYVKDAQHVSTILLARTETATLLDLLLEELAEGEKRHVLVEIDFFDKVDAARFVERQLSDVHKTESHKQHIEPFELALRSMFDVLSETLGCDSVDPWTTPLCRSFLGYAPVLQAIAAHLSEYTNYQEALSDISKVSEAKSQDDILPALMASLITREQGKFTQPLRDRAKPDGSGEPDWVSLYSEEEQIRRVFEYVAGLGEATTPPKDLPEWLSNSYGDALQAFLPSHPFLRGRDFAGPAFRDYVYAKLLVDIEMGPLVEVYLEDIRFVPTPLFAEFYRVFSNGVGSGLHAGYLYESVLARSGLEHAALTTFVDPELAGSVHRFAVLSDAGGTTEDSFSIDLDVTEAKPLIFRHRLRGAVLNVRGTIMLSAPAQFELGDVEIQTEALELNTPLLLVRAHHGQQKVLIQSEQTVKHDSHFRVEVKAGLTLRVNWPGAHRYPWSPYADERLFAETPDRQGAMLALRRILIWFRKDRKEELGRFRELIDNVIIGHNSIRQHMRDFLLKKEILRVEGKQYKIDSEAAQRFGINWSALRTTTLTPTLIPLLDEFLQELNDHLE